MIIRQTPRANAEFPTLFRTYAARLDPSVDHQEPVCRFWLTGISRLLVICSR